MKELFSINIPFGTPNYEISRIIPKVMFGIQKNVIIMHNEKLLFQTEDFLSPEEILEIFNKSIQILKGAGSVMTMWLNLNRETKQTLEAAVKKRKENE